MFGDFEVSNTGDLLFKTQTTENVSLRLKFALTNTAVQKLSFDLEEFDTATPTEDALRVSFDIKKKIANMTASFLRERRATGQLATLKLKTAVGELPRRKEFGSMLAKISHKEINDANLKLIESYVLDCISDIVSNPSVSVTPDIAYTNGYTQGVKIVIYDNSSMLATYVLER